MWLTSRLCHYRPTSNKKTGIFLNEMIENRGLASKFTTVDLLILFNNQCSDKRHRSRPCHGARAIKFKFSRI